MITRILSDPPGVETDLPLAVHEPTVVLPAQQRLSNFDKIVVRYSAPSTWPEALMVTGEVRDTKPALFIFFVVTIVVVTETTAGDSRSVYAPAVTNC